jgi:hypothetical protein
MKKFFCCCALAAVLVPASASVAQAGDVNLNIANGRVTLVAQDATIRQILAEWARVGQTKIVNGDKMMGPPVTMELRDVPESKALETILRSAAGYVATPRIDGRVGMSSFDAVVILPTSRPPMVQVSAPPSFNNRPQPVMPQVDDDDDREPLGDQPQQQQPGPPGQQFPGQPMPGPTPGGQQPPQNFRNTPGPMTSPVPGQLPQPQATPANPYQPQPGTRPPTQPGQPTRPGGGGGGGEGTGRF